MSRHPKADGILAKSAQVETQIDNGRDSRRTRSELAAELRQVGGGSVADLFDPATNGGR
jgi:hypothetical protein